MIQEQITGKVEIDGEGRLVIVCEKTPQTVFTRDIRTALVILEDGRKISPEQRRKCYALLGEIAEYINGWRNEATVEETKRLMKMEFMLKRMESMERRLFSLANVDVTTARHFIDFLIEFIIENGVPTTFPLIDKCEDIEHYVYVCLLNKKCAVCGRAADLHHVDAIGSGNNRNKVDHIGRRALPLCRIHHTELHGEGNESFMGKYHLEPVKIDEKIAKIYKLKGGENGRKNNISNGETNAKML